MSAGDDGSFNFSFDGVATLGLLVSAFFVFLGYRLMVLHGPHPMDAGAGKTKVAGTKLAINSKRLKLTLVNAAPGVIFAALGLVGLVASLFHFMH
ncbi:hypothetical protein SAMN05444161_8514 [Rhizobiales bacterium GAS191]|nr:hypothetical protein SAMN05444161_8514 [Rhizobiales bacterium GAS191]